METKRLRLTSHHNHSISKVFMQSITYQYEENTLGIDKQHQGGTDTEGVYLGDTLSSISREFQDIPDFHLFSSTVLHFMSTVFIRDCCLLLVFY